MSFWLASKYITFLFNAFKVFCVCVCVCVLEIILQGHHEWFRLSGSQIAVYLCVPWNLVIANSRFPGWSSCMVCIESGDL